MKKVIAVIVVIALLAIGYVALRQYRQARAAREGSSYNTVPAEKGSLTATVGATGIVRANQTAMLVWQASGKVEQVNVQPGSQVASGDSLASLAQTSLPQNLIMAQADLASAQKNLDDLVNSKLQQAKAQQAVEDAKQALEDAQDPALAQAKAQQAVAQAQKTLEQAQRALNNAQTVVDQTYIDQAYANMLLAKDKRDKAQERFDPYATKPETNLVRATLLSQLAQAQQQYEAALAKYNNLKGTSNPTELAIRQADFDAAKASLADAQLQWERIKDGTSPAQIALLQAQLEDAQRQAEQLKSGADPNDVAAAQARVAAAQAALELAQLKAPFAGTITEVDLHPGDLVAPGAQAFRLDDLSHLLVDVQVSEVDINRIQVGQQVTLTFDAIPGKEYQGKVTQVAPVGSSSQGVVDFTVTVELVSPDQEVRPGMTAAVNIVVRQLSEVLLVPNRAVRVKDGQRVVYVLRAGFPEAVTVELGASSDTDSEVVGGGLNQGDLIVLNPPTVLDAGSRPGFISR